MIAWENKDESEAEKEVEEWGSSGISVPGSNYFWIHLLSPAFLKIAYIANEFLFCLI